MQEREQVWATWGMGVQGGEEGNGWAGVGLGRVRWDEPGTKIYLSKAHCLNFLQLCDRSLNCEPISGIIHD